ncbi:hypothetical protein LNO81_31035 [Klebsiella variicola subsp. variicola]|nr:hypothetical protein [Klebsiella variicola subsp. variicola]
MKAITFEQFGPANVLNLSEVADPQLRPNDLLVRTRAAGSTGPISPIDAVGMAALILATRRSWGWKLPVTLLPSGRM